MDGTEPKAERKSKATKKANGHDKPKRARKADVADFDKAAEQAPAEA